MPIKVSEGLPAIKVLEKENIFIMTKQRADRQDIRPLKILILNLMPTKVETEIQLLRLLGNTPLQVDVELLQTKTHHAKNVSQDHLLQFYKTFDEVVTNWYDGLIITGAPVEKLPFEAVDYWPELCRIMDWSKSHVWSTLHICWGAQAGLYRHYGVQKYLLEKKLSGIYMHRLSEKNHPLARGFDDLFWAPHSRYTGIRAEDVQKIPELSIIAQSDEAGVYLVASRSGRQIFVTGHAEYDNDTLDREYRRDIGKGLESDPPVNYYPHNDPDYLPVMRWKSHAHLLFANWLNYFVYQETPFDLGRLRQARPDAASS